MTPKPEPTSTPVLRWVAGVVGAMTATLAVAALVGIWGAVHRAESATIRLEAQGEGLAARVAEMRADIGALRGEAQSREAALIQRVRVDLDALESRCQQAIRAARVGGP